MTLGEFAVDVRSRHGESGWSCEVDVKEGERKTHHSVAVSRADLERWGGGDREEDVEQLVRRSFEFLLEREPPESILRSFDLSVIQRYFPEYDHRFMK
ncbi:MAG TPA: hypothetical protein VKF28_09310 [Candidatus Dormibacteraeota bacterium]|nr:hypothetical protein [Candidatus Dormibacteraeota bacterium]